MDNFLVSHFRARRKPTELLLELIDFSLHFPTLLPTNACLLRLYARYPLPTIHDRVYTILRRCFFSVDGVYRQPHDQRFLLDIFLLRFVYIFLVFFFSSSFGSSSLLLVHCLTVCVYDDDTRMTTLGDDDDDEQNTITDPTT